MAKLTQEQRDSHSNHFGEKSSRSSQRKHEKSTILRAEIAQHAKEFLDKGGVIDFHPSISQENYSQKIEIGDRFS